MVTAEARIATPHAGKYMAQLCKHFAHKVTVIWTEHQGDVDFGPGTCHMQALAGLLILQCSAETPAGLERVTDIVADHLTRFGWREKLTVDWDSGSVSLQSNPKSCAP